MEIQVHEAISSSDRKRLIKRICARRAHRRHIILATGYGGKNGVTEYKTPRSRVSCKKSAGS